MKNIILFALISALTFASCKKYEEGPTVSLLSRKERIEGKWVVESVKYNSIDSTSAYKKHIWEFTRNYSVILQIDTVKFTGVWSLATSDEDFVIDYDNDKREMYEILKLKRDEFWIRNKQTQYEFHLKPQ